MNDSPLTRSEKAIILIFAFALLLGIVAAFQHRYVSVLDLNTVFAAGQTYQYKINLNTATADELALLRGIGNARAARIIEYRQQNGPFAAVDELVKVNGISRRIIDDIKGLVTVGEPRQFAETNDANQSTPQDN